MRKNFHDSAALIDEPSPVSQVATPLIPALFQQRTIPVMHHFTQSQNYE
jgi:hypothetical protein